MDPTETGFAQQYGYFEIRCQMPNSGTGAWPAFWLTGKGSIQGNGQNNEEIDIFEWYGVCNTAGSYQNVVQQASHNYLASGSQSGGLYSPQTPMPDGSYPWQGYHIYGCQIDPVNVTWYIDGVRTNQIATPSSFITSPFYIMIDYALGGGWPLSGMVNGSSLNVDWVRVYSLPTGVGYRRRYSAAALGDLRRCSRSFSGRNAGSRPLSSANRLTSAGGIDNSPGLGPLSPGCQRRPQRGKISRRWCRLGCAESHSALPCARTRRPCWRWASASPCNLIRRSGPG